MTTNKIKLIYRNKAFGVEGYLLKVQNGIMHIITLSGEVYYGPANEFETVN